MPSAEKLKVKQDLVASITEQLKNACAGVVIDYKGINVADDTALRKEFREAGAHYSVIKNSMLRLAVKNAGLEDLSESFSGSTSIAISDTDAVAPAKIATKYADKIENGFSIKAGFMDGKVLPIDKVIELGKLPSKEQLLAQLANVLSGNLRGLAVALNAIAEKKEQETA